MSHISILSIITDPNGATRQVGFSALIAVLAVLAMLMPSVKGHAKIRALLVSIAAMMVAATVMAYIVRNPCRRVRGYYMGCGMENGVRNYGIALAALIVIVGIILVAMSKPIGWFLVSHGVYYYDYMLQFSHTTAMSVRWAIIAVAAAALAKGVHAAYRAIRPRHRELSEQRSKTTV